MVWEAVSTPAGDWYWFTTLPNGVTAWVIDDSERRKRSTRYQISAIRKGKQLSGAETFESFREAKNQSVFLALEFPRIIDNTYKISAEPSKPKGAV
jgi:hypothetical protein